jgi:hypothetical protein
LLADAVVSVRIISLEEAPAGLGLSVTQATNTQNRIQRRDFAALDTHQLRLAREFALEGVRYVYRSGDETAGAPSACTLEEVTSAAACSHEDLALTVIAKGRIGGLWEDISRPPYTKLFNAATTAAIIWPKVLKMRVVVDELLALANGRGGKERQVVVHGNRFLLRQVFYVVGRIRGELGNAEVRGLVAILVSEICRAIEEEMPRSRVLNRAFVNKDFCFDLEAVLRKSEVLVELERLNEDRRQKKLESAQAAVQMSLF